MTEIERITIHTDSMIKGFFGDYRWLSNYHVSPVIYEGVEYGSSEAAYQSAKCDDLYIKSQFQKLTPLQSKQYSKTIPLKKGWDNIKKGIMYQVLVSKFTLTPELSQQLIETGDKYIEETNYWGDTYWGVCEGRGKNILGELLMQIRKELNDNKLI
jgi:ribA/ribD-fused uncharacterized protein